MPQLTERSSRVSGSFPQGNVGRRPGTPRCSPGWEAGCCDFRRPMLGHAPARERAPPMPWRGASACGRNEVLKACRPSIALAGLGPPAR
jgi:hypothetical protein